MRLRLLRALISSYKWKIIGFSQTGDVYLCPIVPRELISYAFAIRGLV